MKNEYRLLLNRQKKEERKARTHRICTRGGMLEGLLPDTIILNDERFKAFLVKTTANKFGRNILAELVAEQEQEDAANSADTDPQDGEEPTAGTEETEPESGGTLTPEPVEPVAVSNGTNAGRTGNGARSGD